MKFIEINDELWQKPKVGVWYCPKHQNVYLIYKNKYDGSLTIEFPDGCIATPQGLNLNTVYLGKL